MQQLIRFVVEIMVVSCPRCKRNKKKWLKRCPYCYYGCTDPEWPRVDEFPPFPHGNEHEK